MKLEEIMPVQKLRNERVVMSQFRDMLCNEGYPAQSISMEQFISPGSISDMAIYDAERTNIQALLEFKGFSQGNRMRRLRDASTQVLKYLRSLSPTSQIRTFVIMYSTVSSQTGLEIYEITFSTSEIKSKPLQSFPTWSDLNSNQGLFRGLPSSFGYKGEYIKQREKLEHCSSLTRRLQNLAQLQLGFRVKRVQSREIEVKTKKSKRNSSSAWPHLQVHNSCVYSL